jgi:hypothetical protein
MLHWSTLGIGIRVEEHAKFAVVATGSTPALQRHNTENSKQKFPEEGIARHQSQCPHSCVCERLIYAPDPSAGKDVDQSLEYIDRSQTQECGNWG